MTNKVRLVVKVRERSWRSLVECKLQPYPPSTTLTVAHIHGWITERAYWEHDQHLFKGIFWRMQNDYKRMQKGHEMTAAPAHKLLVDHSDQWDIKCEARARQPMLIWECRCSLSARPELSLHSVLLVFTDNPCGHNYLRDCIVRLTAYLY